MKCWNLRELLKGNKKVDDLSGGIPKYFSYIKLLFEGLQISDFDLFSAGYLLGSNPKIKEDLLERIREDEKIRNNS